MYCSNCGAEITADVRFCPQCGHKREETGAATPDVRAEQPVIAEQQPEPVAVQPVIAEQPPEAIAEQPVIAEQQPETVITEQAVTPERPPEPVAEQPPEPVAVQPPEPVAVQPPEPVAEQPPEPVAEQPPEPVAEQPPEPVTERPVTPESPSEPDDEPKTVKLYVTREADSEPIPVQQAVYSTPGYTPPAAAAGQQPAFPPMTPPIPPPKRAKSFGVAFMSVVYAFLLCAAVICLTAFALVRPGNLPKAAGRANIARLLEDTSVPEIIARAVRQMTMPYNDPSHGFADAFYNIQEDDISGLLKRANVKTEAGRLAELYAEAIAAGDFKFYISARDITGFLRAIDQDIQDEFYYKLTSDDYRMINDYLASAWNDALKRNSPDNMLLDDTYARALPQIALSIYPMLFFGIVCALLLINMALLHKYLFRRWFFNIGICAVILGFLYTAAGLLGGPLSFLLDGGEFIVRNALPWFTETLFVAGLLGLAAGALFIICGALISILRKNYIQKQKIKTALISLTFNLTALVACGVVAFLAARMWI